jgi:dihydrofolate reductase
MRKLIMKMSVSMDGFVADAAGKGDWVFKSSDEESKAWAMAPYQQAGLIIMGRKTFESIATYWPTASGPFAELMNTVPKAVFTKSGYKGLQLEAGAEPSPAVASWAAAQVFDGDLVTQIKELKAQSGKPICALGGALFISSLITAGLIDEYYLGVHPIILGKGLSIFGDVTQPRDMKLADVKAFAGGVVGSTYQSV